jgi:hypothetical protein
MLFTTLLLSSFAFAAPDLSCQAIYRTLDEAQRGIEEITDLKAVQVGAGASRYEADLRGKYFSVTADRDGDLLVQITTAPDYTKGSVSKGQLDSLGRYSLSEVDGVTVHRLECRKLTR